MKTVRIFRDYSSVQYPGIEALAVLLNDKGNGADFLVVPLIDGESRCCAVLVMDYSLRVKIVLAAGLFSQFGNLMMFSRDESNMLSLLKWASSEITIVE